jgi:hypothetical protein
MLRDKRMGDGIIITGTYLRKRGLAMMGWKLTKYSLGARPGGMQPGYAHVQVPGYGDDGLS